MGHCNFLRLIPLVKELPKPGLFIENLMGLGRYGWLSKWMAFTHQSPRKMDQFNRPLTHNPLVLVQPIN
jgi:hypothetical protein